MCSKFNYHAAHSTEWTWISWSGIASTLSDSEREGIIFSLTLPHWSLPFQIKSAWTVITSFFSLPRTDASPDGRAVTLTLNWQIAASFPHIGWIQHFKRRIFLDRQLSLFHGSSSGTHWTITASQCNAKPGESCSLSGVGGVSGPRPG